MIIQYGGIWSLVKHGDTNTDTEKREVIRPVNVQLLFVMDQTIRSSVDDLFTFSFGL